MSVAIKETRWCDRCGQEITGKFYKCEPWNQRTAAAAPYTQVPAAGLPTFPGTPDQHVDICLKCWEKLSPDVPGFKWVTKGEKGRGIEPGVLNE